MQQSPKDQEAREQKKAGKKKAKEKAAVLRLHLSSLNTQTMSLHPSLSITPPSLNTTVHHSLWLSLLFFSVIFFFAFNPPRSSSFHQLPRESAATKSPPQHAWRCGKNHSSLLSQIQADLGTCHHLNTYREGKREIFNAGREASALDSRAALCIGWQIEPW